MARGLPRFDGRSALTTWAYRVATNAALDELRRRARRPTPLRAEALPDAPHPSGPPGVDQTVADRDALDRALDALPTEFREPVVLRDVMGLDYAEIATVLGIPGGTVRSRIARGRAALAARLGGDAGNRRAPTSVREGDAP